MLDQYYGAHSELNYYGICQRERGGNQTEIVQILSILNSFEQTVPIVKNIFLAGVNHEFFDNVIVHKFGIDIKCLIGFDLSFFVCGDEVR